MIRYHVCPQPFRRSGIMCVRVRRAGKGWTGDRSASDTRTGRVQPLQYTSCIKFLVAMTEEYVQDFLTILLLGRANAILPLKPEGHGSLDRK